MIKGMLQKATYTFLESLLDAWKVDAETQQTLQADAVKFLILVQSQIVMST